ncbi:MAG: cyclodeaminase/cyclohydrolase family protein [Streptosporangiaceae bacterium]|jgi:formiminotetrahydrofolate cyclodeaminase
MRDETIAQFLTQLAARVPVPGGGATAALHAAQSAALLAMVARYSDGPKYAEHAAIIDRVRTEADGLVTDALGLAEDDAAAFGAVAEAYKLPKDTDEDKTLRSAAIEAALAGAAKPPADVVLAALRLAQLSEELVPVANRNVLSDVGVAAETARAAAVTAALNIEINLHGIKDTELHAQFHGTATLTSEVTAIADRVLATVRREIA